jgi:hypothetical protein
MPRAENHQQGARPSRRLRQTQAALAKYPKNFRALAKCLKLGVSEFDGQLHSPDNSALLASKRPSDLVGAAS